MLTAVQQRLIRQRSDEDDRLLRLFWNRAELKRELASLRRERDRIADVLRQQEGATLRVQQRLEQIEGLLSNPHQAANVTVYYHLRGVWSHARRRLQRLARDLAQRQREAEYQHDVARFEENRQAAIASMKQRLEPLRQRRTVLDGELLTLEERRMTCRGFWTLLRRRRLDSERTLIMSTLGALQVQIDRYTAAIEEKRNESMDAADVISIEGRRTINLAVIALAHELLLHFSQMNIAGMAREASMRSVTEVSYGDIAKCHALCAQIDRALRQLDDLDGLPARVRSRTEQLRHAVRYHRETDTVPVAGSFAASLTHVDAADPGQEAALSVNVLADEYWDVFSVLLH